MATLTLEDGGPRRASSATGLDKVTTVLSEPILSDDGISYDLSEENRI